MKYKFNFYTQYHQFYLCDKDSPKETDSDTFWTQDAYRDRLAKENGILGIQTQCYGNVKGELDILSKANTNIDTAEYDHIVESGLNVSSDTLLLMDCPNLSTEMKVKVKPGSYRVRIYSSNLKSVVDDDGDDFYKIEIWPSLDTERKVLKKFVSN